MEYLFDEWKRALDEFQKCADKTMENIRKEKMALQHMKEDYFSGVDSCYYIHDDRRIVLSAPEIIIGNVDANGVLKDYSSTIIIRGSKVDIEAVGALSNAMPGGTITNRAAKIMNIAVDPGLDGLENVVGKESTIVSQAKSIVLQSAEGNGVFVEDPLGGEEGITLSSNTKIKLDALPFFKQRSEKIKDAISAVDAGKITTLNNNVGARLNTVKGILDKLAKLGEEEEKYLGGDKTVCTKYRDIADIHRRREALSVDAANAMNNYIRSVSMLAEANYRAKALDDMKKEVGKKKENSETKSTGNSITLRSESFAFESTDGDGNDRTNPEAGFSVKAQSIRLASIGKDNALMEKGAIKLAAKDIDLSTANPKYDNDNKSAEFPAYGKVNVVSKEINLEAVDYSYKDDKKEEKELSKEGRISMRAMDIQALSTATDGKAAGSLSLNAKNVEIKSMDVDKEKKTDTALAEGGATTIVSEKVFVGSKDSKTKSKQMQISSEQVGVFAAKTAELQQDKALVQLDGGNIKIASGGNEISGKTDFKGDITAPKATINNLEAKNSLKSQNITDGMSAPSKTEPNPTGELKETDAPQIENQ